MAFARAAAWSASGELLARLVPPAVLAYLVLILPVEDFGVVAAVSGIVGFCQVFWDAGLMKALVQTRRDEASAASVVFWSNLALGALLYFIIFGASGWIAGVFSDPRIALTLRVLGLQVVLLSAASAYTGLLQRRMAFRDLFFARIGQALVSGIASILAVRIGLGLWALVAGILTGSVTYLAIVVLRSDWRPTREFDRSIVIELVRFSRWTVLTGFLGWFFVFADSLIVGAFLGVRDLGLYNVSSQLASLSFGLMLAPLLPVLYSTLVRRAADASWVRASMLVFSQAIAYWVVPIAAIAFVQSGAVSALLFDEQWEGIEEILTATVLAAAVSWFAVANGEAYRALGRPEIESRVMLLCVPIYIVGYLIAVQQGVAVFAWVRVALAIVGFCIHVMFAHRILRISWWRSLAMLSRPLTAGLAVVVFGLFFLRPDGEPSADPTRLVATSVLLFLVYFVAAFALDRRFLMQEIVERIRGMR
jgi:O-antigen/teichoic acid export membrane protein